MDYKQPCRSPVQRASKMSRCSCAYAREHDIPFESGCLYVGNTATKEGGVKAQTAEALARGGGTLRPRRKPLMAVILEVAGEGLWRWSRGSDRADSDSAGP